jgi:hypothetical protein
VNECTLTINKIIDTHKDDFEDNLSMPDAHPTETKIIDNQQSYINSDQISLKINKITKIF